MTTRRKQMRRAARRRSASERRKTAQDRREIIRTSGKLGRILDRTHQVLRKYEKSA